MKHTVTFLAALLFTPLTSLCAADPKPTKPNFVVILIDDMGYTRWMEAMGPTLDKLLNERP